MVADTFIETMPGRVRELYLDEQGLRGAWIECPPGKAPEAGQYLLAWDPADRAAPLAAALFPAQIERDAFQAAAPVPPGWQPGTRLALRGPLGKGFSVPAQARRVVLAALGESASRLLALVPALLARETALALFTDCPLPALPPAVEIYPLAGLPEALAWADFLALDLPVSKLDGLRRVLRLEPGTPVPCPAHALVLASMPCGGVAECGACAVPRRGSGWRLACQEGPVFDLHTLSW